MMYPEMMHVLVEARQEELRRMASREPMIPGLNDAARNARQVAGRAMIRLGSWMAGHTPRLAEPITGHPGMANQDA